jgi:hypothetical protein
MFQRAQHAAPLRNSVAARHDRLRRVTCCAARQKIKRALRLLRVNLKDACAGGQALGKQRNEKAAKAPGLKTRSFVRVNRRYERQRRTQTQNARCRAEGPGATFKPNANPSMNLEREERVPLIRRGLEMRACPHFFYGGKAPQMRFSLEGAAAAGSAVDDS